jgi:hypothetical protein
MSAIVIKAMDWRLIVEALMSHAATLEASAEELPAGTFQIQMRKVDECHDLARRIRDALPNVFQ